MSSTATPFWYGAVDRLSFGWLHLPESGRARGGVVLCQPVGYEYICTYQTFALLARRLADGGSAVLRYDHPSTGDSMGGDDDPGVVEGWLDGVDRAVDELIDRGATDVTIVGMRAGALLAATAASQRRAAHRLVLWDPVTSGRSFIRESQMLRMVGAGVDDEPRTDGSVEAAGAVFAAATVASLKQLDLTKLDEAVADELLVIHRTDRSVSDKVREKLRGLAVAVEEVETTEQAPLLDVVSAHSAAPTVAIEEIAKWIEARQPEQLAAVRDGGQQELHLEVEGRAVIERPTWLGPLGLFAIVSEPDGEPSEDRWVIGLNNSTDHHIGPIRLWVELGRALAGRGRRVARIDLSGIGDSPVRPGQVEHLAYAPEAFDDVVMAAAALSPDDPHDVELVGLCSGGFVAVDVAAIYGIASVYAINPMLGFKPPDQLQAPVVDADAPIRAGRPPRWWMRNLSGTDVSKRVAARIPPIGWDILERTGLHPSPAQALRTIEKHGTRLVLVYGDDDDGYRQLQQRARHDLKRVEGSSTIDIVIVPGLDHAMMVARHRQTTQSLLLELLTDPPPPTNPPKDPS